MHDCCDYGEQDDADLQVVGAWQSYFCCDLTHVVVSPFVMVDLCEFCV